MRVPILLAAVLLGGCATTGTRTAGDPYEGFNRAVWGFNQGVDKVVLKPASSVYRTVTPKPARRGVSNFFSNLSEPWTAINALLQGKPKRALNALGRFVVNTTIGVGGLADHATGFGLPQRSEDLGQTLAVWGVKSSAYLVLPLLGPSTVRDGVGSVAAQFADPYRVCLRECGLPNGLPTGLNVLEVVNTRSQLTDVGADQFLKTAADPYAVARSAYFQRREAAIADQDGGGGPPVGAGPAARAGGDAALDEALKELDAADTSGTPVANPAGATPSPPPGTPSPAQQPADPAAPPPPPGPKLMLSPLED